MLQYVRLRRATQGAAVRVDVALRRCRGMYLRASSSELNLKRGDQCPSVDLFQRFPEAASSVRGGIEVCPASGSAAKVTRIGVVLADEPGQVGQNIPKILAAEVGGGQQAIVRTRHHARRAIRGGRDSTQPCCRGYRAGGPDELRSVDACSEPRCGARRSPRRRRPPRPRTTECNEVRNCSGGEARSFGQSGTCPATGARWSRLPSRSVPAEPARRPGPACPWRRTRGTLASSRGLSAPRVAVGIERQRCRLGGCHLPHSTRRDCGAAVIQPTASGGYRRDPPAKAGVLWDGPIQRAANVPLKNQPDFDKPKEPNRFRRMKMLKDQYLDRVLFEGFVWRRCLLARFVATKRGGPAGSLRRGRRVSACRRPVAASR